MREGAVPGDGGAGVVAGFELDLGEGVGHVDEGFGGGGGGGGGGLRLGLSLLAAERFYFLKVGVCGHVFIVVEGDVFGEVLRADLLPLVQEDGAAEGHGEEGEEFRDGREVAWVRGAAEAVDGAAGVVVF